MSSYRNRYQSRRRSREPLDRRMDKWIETGKQVVDGVAGNRPGQRRLGLKENTTGANFERVGRWMEEKIDWFFEDEDDWLEDEDSNNLKIEEKIINTKRPLSAISLRVPKALPSQIDQKRNILNDNDQWPDDQSFELNRWERKTNLTKQNEHSLKVSSREEIRSTKRRNIPKSSRRKY